MENGKKLTAIGEIGGKINANEIIKNILHNHKNFAQGMGLFAWVNKVLPGHDWDFKANKNTIFGAAWAKDAKSDIKTQFTFSNNGSKYSMNAADFGNYHAGYTGTIAGISASTQYKFAGLGEIKKDMIDNQNYQSGANRLTELMILPMNMPSSSGFGSVPVHMPSPPYGDRPVDYQWNTKVENPR